MAHDANPRYWTAAQSNRAERPVNMRPLIDSNRTGHDDTQTNEHSIRNLDYSGGRQCATDHRDGQHQMRTIPRYDSIPVTRFLRLDEWLVQLPAPQDNSGPRRASEEHRERESLVPVPPERDRHVGPEECDGPVSVLQIGESP